MSTVQPVPAGYPAEIIGYAEPWIVSPGDDVKIKISSTEPEYTYRVVRLIQGHSGENYPPAQEDPVDEIESETLDGRFQLARPGSYGFVDLYGRNIATQGIQRLVVSLHFQSHLPQAGHVQTLISTLDTVTGSGFALVLLESGIVELRVGTETGTEHIRTSFVVAYAEWVEARITFGCKESLVDIELIPVPAFAQCPTQRSFLVRAHQCRSFDLFQGKWLFLASGWKHELLGSTPEPYDFFNGRLSRLGFVAELPGGVRNTIVKYDFTQGLHTDILYDASGSEAHCRLVNAPTRAVTDHEWDGSEQDWTKARYGYGAIHFHQDDLDDAAWATDFEVKIPLTARSGAYAIKVQAKNGNAHDDIVFFVRPSVATAAKVDAKVAFVLSTFTYLAYGNERMYDQSKPSRMEAPEEGFAIHKDWQFERMQRRTDLGLSCYDVHEDGSGVVYSSPRRPLLAVRPDHINWAMGRPREFSADLLMIAFLEHMRVPYDVITDHDLHFSQHGFCLTDRYNVLITGGHPEYPTLQSLNAYTSFARRGGSIMYLGGNGFYWSAAMKQTSPSPALERLEVRRGDQGVRSYTLPGGEIHFSTNGQRGALWRSRGRSPNVLFGVGTAGEGTGPGVPFRRTLASRSEACSWIFDGINDETIGRFGFGGGASGDEIDKFDIRNGSPRHAIVVATSTGHPDSFGIFPEDCGFPLKDTCGTQTREIRSDMVYLETQNGGRVFSVGSINWYCSLAWCGFDNDVARLTYNVLQRFVAEHSATPSGVPAHL